MLDFTTVFVFSTGITLFVCFVTGLAWFADESGVETRNWFLASLLQLCGSLLMISGDVIPLQIGGYIGGIITTAASGYLALGYRQLFGQQARPGGVLLVAFGTGTAVYLTKFLSGNQQDGIWMLYFGSSINLFVAARTVCVGARSERLRFGRFAAWSLGAYAGTYLAVAPLALLFPVRFVEGKPVSVWLEITTIPLVLLNLTAFLMTLVVKLERAKERQRHLATYDSLTGARNRSAFYAAWSRRLGRSGVLAVIDLDHFKTVNDSYGHRAGDDALLAFSKAVSAVLPRNAVFGRLGGEEFAVLLNDLDAANAARHLESLREKVATMAIDAGDGRWFTITFSGGYVAFEETESDMDRIFTAADRAMYAAKDAGRDRVVLFDPNQLLHRDVQQLRSISVTASGSMPVRA
ncbi:diguanylate cyclase (GGDEF)-like protein [Rhizobium aquaticum]|uniref:diguanylate cyclase n=1 Tax=Rhizobium aquaticum TaxID=1549636 RepID=A0ABV2J612_9HYPH